MTPDAPGYKVCYKHPKRVAVRDCGLCGRPICKQCALESGDPLLCMTCKQDTMLHGDRLLKQGQDKQPGSQQEARQTLFEVGEVTVLDDGTVVKPEATPNLVYEPEEDVGEPLVPPLALEAQDAEGTSQAEPAAEATSGETAAGTTAATMGETITKTKLTAPKMKKSVMGREPGTGLFSQLLYASRYAVTVGVLVSAAWLLVAVFGKQWTQISVFTLGLAVPWALYNATTRKKYLGVRVWMEPPPVIYMSAVSFVTVLALTFVMELLARLLIFGTKFPVSDFAQRYFKPTDWVLIVCGFALSALTPFVLKFGADMRAPSFRKLTPRRSKQKETEATDHEPAEQLESDKSEGPEEAE